MNNRNFILVVIVLACAACISYCFYFPVRLDTDISVRMADFPKTIGEWVSEELPVSESVYKMLQTRNLIMRNYKNQRQDAVNLYIIYSQDNRKVSHPQEIYLQGEGDTITNKSMIQLTPSIRATKLILDKANSRELIVYWYKVGQSNTNSYLIQQLRMSIDKMLGKKTAIALIRVLAEIDDKDEEGAAALRKIKDFCLSIEPLLEKYVP